ncbi:hypothetical protein KIPE111705_40410 [Kibdelosporangium persicum]|uniref:Uncharacterized protein n=1 Tax=Kibdelosporangium persicum TaxID=2698649 RepID=A0ABX2FIY6_9PSEU|nr:hypothetical protein [Kibdelosporangium persicum]NRN70693.1 hypothetical protein [Kibdelosporangium persicum]
MHFTSTRTVDDAYYDELTIRTNAEQGVVEVSGKQVPTVVLRRSPDAELNKFVPIGSRNADHLTMSVDGVEAELRPGPGKLTRRSHRVELTLAGTRYEFTPDDDDATQLRRNGATIASFHMDDDGKFTVHWLAERDDSQPADAAIGYALSVGFRTGAKGVFTVLLNGSENVPWTP